MRYSCVYTYIYIYIYIERERGREIERESYVFCLDIDAHVFKGAVCPRRRRAVDAGPLTGADQWLPPQPIVGYSLQGGAVGGGCSGLG